MGKRGPPDLGKTATIKRRRIDVYLPTLEAKERWNAAAAGRHQKVSEMVFELVETALAPPAEPAGNVHALLEEREDLQAALDAERRRAEELALAKEKLERDLQEYRALDILGEPTLPKVDARLVRIFSQARGRDGKLRAVDVFEVRKALRIAPGQEATLKALNVSLEHMELHGWLRRSGKGWVWIGG